MSSDSLAPTPSGEFAGYPVAEELGPCPGGTAFRALHPASRTPVVVRRVRADWLAPADNLPAFVLRAQAAAAFTHPHLAQLLDAGVYQDEAFVSLEPFDGADLETQVRDDGPVSIALVTEYGRQLALALAAAHAHGLVHGHIQPACVRAALPAVEGGEGTARLFELGLVPYRPTPDPDSSNPSDGIEYLPPERLTATDYTPAGDVYGLGATLYFLLTGRPPFATGTVAEVVARMRSETVPPLGSARPDAPPELAKVIEEMMATDPAARPTASAVADALEGAAPEPSPQPFVFTPTAFEPVAEFDGEAPVDRPARTNLQEPPPNRLMLWMVVGGLLWVLSFGLWYFYIFAGPAPSPEPASPPKKVQKTTAPPKPRDTE